MTPPSIHSCARLIMLRYTRCNSDFDGCSCVADGVPQLLYESNPHTIQELIDNISHVVAAIKITMLHRLCLNTIRCAQLCIDGISIHHLATVLLSVYTLCYGPGLLFRSPFCIKIQSYVGAACFGVTDVILMELYTKI